MPSTEFFLTSLVVVLIPGTGVIYTVSAGLFSGWRASIAAACGCTAGIVPHLLASILGLSALLHASAQAFQLVKFAGALYLLYLAWSMWRDTGSMKFSSSGQPDGLFKVAVRGFLINILNPKLSIFFLAFLPLFVTADGASPLGQMLLLSVLFMGLTLVVFVLYGLSAHSVRTYLAHSPRFLRWMQRTFAVTFAALAGKLLASEQ